MAIGNTDNTIKRGEYPTDDASMMQTAKTYARQDHKQTWEVISRLKESGDELTEENMAKHLLDIKFENIKNSRLNRVSYYD